MIKNMADESTVFEKANSAARASVSSVVELARRTHTAVIVFRDGQIKRLIPDAFREVEVEVQVRPDKAADSDDT